VESERKKGSGQTEEVSFDETDEGGLEKHSLRAIRVSESRNLLPLLRTLPQDSDGVLAVTYGRACRMEGFNELGVERGEETHLSLAEYEQERPVQPSLG
jgi:hypothetical protein